MGAQNKLFHRMIWLIDTVYSAGHIKMAEIDRKLLFNDPVMHLDERAVALLQAAGYSVQ